METAARLQRCLALYSVIAWRIVYGTMLARAVPDIPCTALLDADEWQALYCAIHRTAVRIDGGVMGGVGVRWIAQYSACHSSAANSAVQHALGTARASIVPYTIRHAITL